MESNDDADTTAESWERSDLSAEESEPDESEPEESEPEESESNEID